MTDGTGALLAINSYDEYGIPGSGNARPVPIHRPGVAAGARHAIITRPASTRRRWAGSCRPIRSGTAGGINLYAYVGNDPVNLIDPMGLCNETACVPGFPETTNIVGFGGTSRFGNYFAGPAVDQSDDLNQMHR